MLFPVFRKDRKRRGLVISVEREKGGEGGGRGGVAEAKYTFRFVLRWAYHREVGGSISGDA